MKRHISLDQLDFRLLNVFITIFRERHVGRAADTLGMSQPTVSTLLARLRRISGDPLFIRSAQGMQPTVLARNWAEPVASALTMLESALNAPSDFDAATSQRTFSVYMTDVGQMLMLNRLISRIETTAPGIRIRTIGTWEGTLADQLDDRSIDIAFGWIPQLKARKTSSLLFKDRYVGVHDAATAPALHRYAVAYVPNSAHQIVPERFQLHGIKPVITVPNFFMLPEVLTGTSITAVVPERLVRLLSQQRSTALRIVELPFKLPMISIRVHWSAGTWRDEGIDWLRNQIIASVNDYPPIKDFPP
ncbi:MULTISPECIES: LysR family transcriptional regulator [Photorhabdus]|uniref:HTH lysR-type domain-containing protein n=1 Tax=Photorhabdus thracensis TaxID=230089 RepID=A0A0F7LFZ1_9GAMM|nr:LysR family transcriptional regulator [Photorhabdus thracensis]AKH62014.1 hypothetical protein VY86_00170 [Photorhabdus thracensis]MCC8421997.1 LysR family transcriptional regulator [Photorhabdus thracensis]